MHVKLKYPGPLMLALMARLKSGAPVPVAAFLLRKERTTHDLANGSRIQIPTKDTRQAGTTPTRRRNNNLTSALLPGMAPVRLAVMPHWLIPIST